MLFISVKEINNLISKKCHTFTTEKIDVIKTSIFSERKPEEMQVIFEEMFILALSFSAVFRLQIRVSKIYFDLFFSGDKKVLSESSLGNGVDFTDIINIWSNILAKMRDTVLQTKKHF